MVSALFALKQPGWGLVAQQLPVAQPLLAGLSLRRSLFLPPGTAPDLHRAQLTAMTSAAYGHPCNLFAHSTIQKQGEGDAAVPTVRPTSKAGRKQEGHAHACPHI